MDKMRYFPRLAVRVNKGFQGKDHLDFFLPTLLYRRVNLCLFLLDERVSQPVSDKRELIETNFVLPVTIRAVSF